MDARNSLEPDTNGPDTLDSVTELDLALVHALQVRPRAAWAELAVPLGVAPSTLARRWARLSGAGLAWVTAAPGREFFRSRCSAFALVRCRHGCRNDVVARLAQHREVATIETTVGSTDLLLDLLTTDLRALSRFLTEQLEELPGIDSTSVVLATSMYAEGSRWRLGSLDAKQLAALPSGPVEAWERQRPVLTPVDNTVLEHLVRDGRLSWSDLARSAGVSSATVRRRVTRLVAAGIVTFRCDLADALAGWPLPISLFARAPAGDVTAICRTLATFRECRVAAAVTGPANILATFWAADLTDVQRLETAIHQRLPNMAVTDRIAGLHTAKRMGHLLDEQGRRVGVEPITPW